MNKSQIIVCVGMLTFAGILIFIELSIFEKRIENPAFRIFMIFQIVVIATVMVMLFRTFRKT